MKVTIGDKVVVPPKCPKCYGNSLMSLTLGKYKYFCTTCGRRSGRT